MYVCLCRGITDRQVRQAVADGASSVRDVNEMLGTDIECGKCGLTTRQIVRQELERNRDEISELFYQAS